MRQLEKVLFERSARGTPLGADELIARVNLELAGETPTLIAVPTGEAATPATDATRTQPRVPPRRWPRWAVAFAGALVLVVAGIGLPLLIFGGETGPTEQPVTTVAPATTVPPTPTTVPPNTSETPDTTTATTTTAIPVTPARLEITWQQAPTQPAFGFDDVVTSVIEAGPGLVAAGGVFTDDGSDYQAAVWTSVDGVTWERAVGLEGFDDVLSDITDGPGGMVAVSARGSLVGDFTYPPLLISPDGKTWSRVTGNEEAFPESASLSGITVGGPGYVAFGTVDEADAAIWVSGDALTWTRVEEALGEGYAESQIMDVVETSAGLVAVGNGEGSGGSPRPFNDLLVWTSQDGIAWDRAALDSERGMALALASSGDVSVAAGYVGNYLMAWVAEAGSPFTAHTIAASSYIFPFDVLVDGDRLLTVGFEYVGTPPSSAVAWASDDGGVTWFEITRLSRSEEDFFGYANDQRPAGFRGVIKFGDGFVAVGATGNGSAPVWTGAWNEE